MLVLTLDTVVGGTKPMTKCVLLKRFNWKFVNVKHVNCQIISKTINRSMDWSSNFIVWGNFLSAVFANKILNVQVKFKFTEPVPIYFISWIGYRMRIKYNVSHRVSADCHCHSVINSNSVIFATTLDIVFIKNRSLLTKRIYLQLLFINYSRFY